MSVLAPRRAASEPAPVEARRAWHYLHPGGLVVSCEPLRVTTILGSCVSVCLWDPRGRRGGLNHYLLPHWARAGVQSPRAFGNVALHDLVEGLLEAGGRREDLQARIYGGACVLRAMRARHEHLGAANVSVARRFLRAAAIPVIEEDVGGQRGRRLVFCTDDGSARVHAL